MTFKNAYSIDHYAAPRYEGAMYYFIPNLDYAQRVNIREEAKWANLVSSVEDSYFSFCPVVPSGAKWQWGNIFPSGTKINAPVWMTTGFIMKGASATSEMTISEEDTSTISYSSSTATSVGPGIANLTGGTLNVGNVFGLVGGSTTFNMSGGTLNCASVGILAIAGMDVCQDKSTYVFNQSGGTLNSYGLMIGGIYGDWETTKNGFGQYVLGGGTLNAKASTGWNSFGGGLCLAAKGNTRGTTSCAPGVFTQTGGVANVDFVRFGVEKAGTSYSNTIGFGLLDIAGGRFNLGSSGFLLGSTWNYSTAASYSSNACYRVRLSGGTFAPTATVINVQMDLPPSDCPVVFEPQRDVIVQAPIWGEGTLKKAGSKSMTLTDVSRFTGAIDVDEGWLDIAAAAEDPDDATCIKWTGDSAAAGLADGDTVEVWPEENNEGARKAIAYTAKSGCYQPPCPTLAANAFGTHAGVKFSASAMKIPAADNPVSGQTNWTVVVVFKTTQSGGCDNNAHDYQWCYTSGMLGNSATGWEDEGWGLSAGNAPVVNSIVFGVGYAGGGYAPIESARGGRANGKVHVLVCTQSTWDQTTTVNLDGIMTSRGGNGSARQAHSRYNVDCYLGFHSSQATKDTTAANFADNSFNGTFAEIRFYQNRVLSVNEQNSLIRALLAKYGSSAAAASSDALPTPAVAFDADSVEGEDGAAVETWAADSGAVSATKELGGGSAAPTLVKGGFAGHNALRFNAAAKSALGIAHDSIPWLDQKNFGAAIVFRTRTDGLDDEHDTYGNTIQGRGLISTAGSQKKSVNGFSLSFRTKGTVASFYKTTDLDHENFRKQLIHTKKPCLLNDGAVHVAVTAYDETSGKFRLMVDGYYTETSYAATAAQNSSQNLLIGSLNNSSDKYFEGEIAEVKLFDVPLSRDEMQALTDDWAQKYNFRPLTGKLVESLDQISGTGIAASSISVAADATLSMPSATLGSGQSLAVAGRLEGGVTLADGATLKATVGEVGEMDSLSVTGEVTLDVSGLSSNPQKWTQLVKVGSYSENNASWRIVGDNVSQTFSVKEKDGFLSLHAARGAVILVR